MPPKLQATLTDGSVGRHLYEMTMPMVWGLLATMSFNVVDTFFVAQLGDKELAAMGFTFPVVMVLTSIAIGLGAGTSSAVARAIGAGDQAHTKRLATDGMGLTVILSILSCLLGWLTIDPLFTLLGASQELLPFIHQYMSIWYLSAPFLMIPMVTLASMRAMGEIHVQGYIMIAGALLNAALDPVLIFGLGGFPRLELEGAAWATFITRACIFVASFYVLQVRMGMLVNPLVSMSKVFQSWKAILHIGIPAMVTNIIIPFSSAVVVWLVSGYGENAVAGLSVAVRIEPVALIVFYALSGVVGPFCGQNLGAGQKDRLFQVQKVITFFCLMFGLLLAVLLWLFGQPVVELFSDTVEVQQVAIAYLAIVPISYGAYGLVMAINASFNGLGMPLPGVMISFFRVFGFYIPLVWLLMNSVGIKGLFIATAIANLLAAVIAYLWLQWRLQNLPEMK